MSTAQPPQPAEPVQPAEPPQPAPPPQPPAPTVFTEGFDADIVESWIADDPDEQTRTELTSLLEAAIGSDGAAGDAAAVAELEDRFAAPLSFGTAGLRGALGGGPNRMNRAVVIRAAAGLAGFLCETLGEGFRVVIGCDARYGSADFARDTATVVTAAGGQALLLPDKLPTPVLAFALGHLDADAGVMVTASHNPPQDNGYKVYLGARPLQTVLQRQGDSTAAAAAEAGAGAQIVPPFDDLIAAHIAGIATVAGTPRAESGWETVGEQIVEDYLSSIDALGQRLGAVRTAPLRIVITSLHGVGGVTMRAALERAGFDDVHAVAAQEQPDPDFPTVTFPNPEEDGALDAAIALADEVGADLIIANDPDADRMSAAIPVRPAAGVSVGPAVGVSVGPAAGASADAAGGAVVGTEGGASGWRQLTGDEVGLLLGEHIAARSPQNAVLANSIVSSRALAAAAKFHGLEHAATLTGFKWISRVPDVAFGYEEALGYCVDPQVVRDKDGISAGVVFASLVSALAEQGRSVDDELERIRTRDGAFVTQPLTFRLTDTSLIGEAMARLRAAAPAQLAGHDVTEVADLAEGSAQLPPTDGMMLLTAAGDRVIIRPSGTEPKLKCYLEAAGELTQIEAARARLEQMRADLTLFFGL